MGDNMSPADVAAVVGNTDRNNGFAYPVYMNGGNGFGNSGFGDGSWIWLILILALFGDDLSNYIKYTKAFINDPDAKKDKITNYFL